MGDVADILNLSKPTNTPNNNTNNTNNNNVGSPPTLIRSSFDKERKKKPGKAHMFEHNNE